MSDFVAEVLAKLPIESIQDDFLEKRIGDCQSFLGIKHSEIDLLERNILRSLEDIESATFRDASEEEIRQKIVSEKVSNICAVEEKLVALELECQRISRERLRAADAVEEERERLRAEIDALIKLQQSVEMRRLIREMVVELALPNEMMNFQVIDGVLDAHQRDVERLERAKIGATPSQIELISKQIDELEQKLNEQLNKINFQQEPNGRKFYYDQDGQKKYLNEFRVFMDELGDYILEANGEKAYLREYAVDEYGRYYLNEDDERIYKATPNAPESRLRNGVLFRVRGDAPTAESDGDVSMASRSEYEGKASPATELLRPYGEPLRKALVSLVRVQPVDPIDYIEKFLRHFEGNEMRKGREREFFNELERKRKIVARRIFNEQVNERRKLVALESKNGKKK